MGVLVLLATVYVAGAGWGFVKSGGAKWDWEWPVRLAVVGWNKLFGKDSVLDSKDEE
jgi:hypothetical protein